jgi:hypothetical protein
LKVRSSESFTTSVGVSVTVSVPELAVLSISGGSQARIDGLSGDQISIDVSGGAVLVATGRAMDVTLSSSDGARAELVALSDRVTGSASGGAVATVVGGATVSVQTSGGARVTSE